MAGIISNVWDELLGLMSANLVGVILPGTGTTSNVFSSVQACKKNLLELASAAANSESGGIPPPFFVLQIGDLQPDPEWGLGNFQKRASIAIAKISTQTQNQLSDEMEPLLAAIEQQDHTYFQVPDQGSLSTSENDPVNQTILADAKYDGLLAATISFTPGLLVG